MLSATGIHVSYGPQTVLNEINLTIDERTRGGLIGANGSGKTTLLKVLSGLEQPESGSIVQARGATVEYLPQRSTVPNETTVFSFADEGYRAEHSMIAEREELGTILSDDPHNESALSRVAEIDHLLEDRGYYTRKAQIGRVLNGLGFHPTDYDRPLVTFSGGWKMRAALARSLLSRPDILLLDEPTNYLDSEARLWLSSFLRRFRGGFILVSHDRAFLDDTVTTIYELFQATIRRYTGTYTTYERQRAEELTHLFAAWEAQQREIQRQEEFIRRFRATASKAKQVQSRIKALEKIERIDLPEHLRPISINLPPPIHSGNVVLDLDDVTKSYGDQTVLSSLRFTLHKGRRLAVVGLNGAGKSTLLRLLSGQETPESGAISTGTGVQIAYFAQDSSDDLPGEYTIYDYVLERASDAARPHVRDLLGSFLFSGDTIEKPIEVLSGGERSRVAIASLLVRPANLLIMDEPTNHLDMRSQEVLADALRRYAGTVVVVSHDRSFLRSVSTDVLALWPTERTGDPIPSTHWRFYPGPFTEFEGAALGSVFLAESDAMGSTLKSTGDTAVPQGDDKIDFEAQKNRRSLLRRLDRKEAEILEKIEALETEHHQLQHDLSQPENYQVGETVQRLQEALANNERKRSDLDSEWEQIDEQRRSLG
jgi:ATP-binding cassette subfamily F protein 3